MLLIPRPPTPFFLKTSRSASKWCPLLLRHKKDKMQTIVDFSLSLSEDELKLMTLKKNRGSRFIGLAREDFGGMRRRKTTRLDRSAGAAAEWRHSRSCFVASGACWVNLLSARVSVKATQQRRTATNRPCQEILFFPLRRGNPSFLCLLSVPIYRNNWAVTHRHVQYLSPITLSFHSDTVTVSPRFKTLFLDAVAFVALDYSQ